nr:integrase, catalytic region, zinc finger, CCHC-type, peptidase aspartic, catalytic [Tanacetum cinerariifolium]
MARNFCKFFRKGNRFGHRNRFGKGGNKFGRDTVMVLGIEDSEAQNKSKVVIIVGKKFTSLVCLKCDLLPDDWIVDSGCTKHMTRNRRLFTPYKAYDGGYVIFGSKLKGKVIGGGQLCDVSA